MILSEAIVTHAFPLSFVNSCHLFVLSILTTACYCVSVYIRLFITIVRNMKFSNNITECTSQEPGITVCPVFCVDGIHFAEFLPFAVTGSNMVMGSNPR